MHDYRTHSCAQLRKENVDQTVRLSGWIHKIRDHGGVLFIDLRDAYGLTHGGFGAVYMVATLASAVCLTFVGKLVDYASVARTVATMA